MHEHGQFTEIRMYQMHYRVSHEVCENAEIVNADIVEVLVLSKDDPDR